MNKCYKVTLFLTNDNRIDVLIRGENIPTVAKEFVGQQLTFIPTKQSDFQSFTIFTHTIQRIVYEAATVTPFDNPTFYDVLSF